jgi:hypothetical protein
MRKAKQASATVDVVTVETRGAPAVLKRLETTAARLELEIDDAASRLSALRALGENAVDKAALARVEAELISAKEDYLKTAKVLLSYDRGVSSERKEGEKVSVAEAQEWFAQLILSIRLAVEQVVIADAQSAALCESPEAFYAASAANYRAAVESALSAARKDGVLPGWCSAS